MIVTAAGSAYTVSVEVSAPPRIVWEILTTPGHRLRWPLGSTPIEQVEVLRASLALLSSGAKTEMATRTAG